jgi:hypothetical protein
MCDPHVSLHDDRARRDLVAVERRVTVRIDGIESDLAAVEQRLTLRIDDSASALGSTLRAEMRELGSELMRLQNHSSGRTYRSSGLSWLAFTNPTCLCFGSD